MEAPVQSTFIRSASLIIASVGYSLSVLFALLSVLGDYCGVSSKESSADIIGRMQSLHKHDRSHRRSLRNSTPSSTSSTFSASSSSSSSGAPSSTTSSPYPPLAPPKNVKRWGLKRPTTDYFSHRGSPQIPKTSLPVPVLVDHPLVSSPSEDAEQGTDDNRPAFQVVRGWKDVKSSIPRLSTNSTSSSESPRVCPSRSFLKPKTIRKSPSAPNSSLCPPTLLHASTFSVAEKKRSQPLRVRTQPYQAPYFLPPPDAVLAAKPSSPGPVDAEKGRKKPTRSRTLPPPERRGTSRARSAPSLPRHKETIAVSDSERQKLPPSPSEMRKAGAQT